MYPCQPRDGTGHAVALPQFGLYSPTSPPPAIHVSMAEHRVQVTPPLTPPPLRAPPSVPPFSPSQTRTMAQQEKDDYYARSAAPAFACHATTDKSTTRAAAPSPILLPPKAAFAHSASPLQSPVSLRQALEFGDAGSIHSASGRSGLLRGGRGGADARKSGVVDWSRFSVLVNASEKEHKSDWLERKQGTSKKWLAAGWIAAVLLVVAIVVGIVAGVQSRTDNGDGAPKIADLGIFNSKEVHSSSSLLPSSTLSTVSAPSWTSTSTSTSASTSQSPVVLSETALMNDEVESSSTVPIRTTTDASTTPLAESTTSPKIAKAPGTTSVASSSVTVPSVTVPSTRSTAVVSTRASTSTSRASATSTTASISATSAVHRRRFLNHASFAALRASFAGETIGRVKRDTAGERLGR